MLFNGSILQHAEVSLIADSLHTSNSSFRLIPNEFELPLAALMSSSARHSEIVLIFLNAASRAPIVSSPIAWLTRLSGDTSTACRLTVPDEPILVESSRTPQLTMASTRIWIGFESVSR